MIIGHRLRQLREAKGYSQDAIAEASALTRVHIGKIERGEVSPTIVTFMRILQALKESPAGFFGGQPSLLGDVKETEADLLEMALEVLRSRDTDFSKALEANIRTFYKAVAAVHRMGKRKVGKVGEEREPA